EVLRREDPETHRGDRQLGAPEEHVVELPRAERVRLARVDEAALERVAAVAVEDDTEVPGDRSPPDLPQEAPLVDVVEERRHQWSREQATVERPSSSRLPRRVREIRGRLGAVGPGVTRVAPGDRVAVEPNYACGTCPLCWEGNRNLCLARTAVGIDVDGCFAELVRVPSRCCWQAPATAADEDLALTEPLAVVVRAVGRGGVRSGETVAVVGAGTLGLLALQVARSRGARVLGVGRSDRRLA